ncbi:MAG: molecular chaperone HtpG [Terriglobia bacterium]|nr:MAG: molecular chaperone HtpG [Terriglobia bacterium]
MATTEQILEFQTETKELLHLVIHSLYTRKDIFLRELISNASDALDRLRYESLTRHELLEGNDKFEIRLDVNHASRTLTISDTGIGMSREEVIAHIGTIAKSGTAELRRKLQESGSASDITELIGQFGVGFYSAFMVADRVKLVTRRAGETAATEWESAGAGTYSIKETDKAERGTAITLYLKKPDPESGIEDYTEYWRLADIVKQHSDFVGYPVLARKDDSTEPAPLNSMKPIWKRPPAEVSKEEYDEFYKHVSHDWTEPLKTIHFRAEGTFEYDALLYAPSKAPFDLYYAESESGLRLFAKRVMIMDKCEDLLPHYLRFMRGVVDAADLPLNVSRQRLQQDHHIGLMRKRLTRKIIDTFQEMFDKDREQYLKLWSEFGRAIKEGAGSDFENREKILSLLLFQSSHDASKLTTLKEYKERMKPEQDQVYYLTGESRKVIENSPHLEVFRDKGYEVLYLTDTVDEFVLQHLTEFEGKKLKSAGKGSIQLGTEQEKEAEEKELKERQEEFKPLIEFLEKELSEHVKQVRLSSRLTASPACLVVEDHDLSPMLERAMRQLHEAGPKQKRVLELNPRHRLITRMQQRHATDPADGLLHDAADLVFGLALLAEGSELPDPARFSHAATEVLGKVV